MQEALLPALEALSPEQFEWAMSLVHARYPGLPSGPGEEMQFDVTCLDSLALRQLMDLTQACAAAAKVSIPADWFAEAPSQACIKDVDSRCCFCAETACLAASEAKPTLA